MHVDDAGALVLQCLLHRGREVLRARDGVAVGAAGARPGREVGVVALAALALVEGGADLAAVEQAVLQVADGAPGEVVPDDPDHGQVVFDRRAQHIGRHRETAVTDHRHAGAVGRGERCAHHAADAEAHAGVAPAVEHALRALGLPELHEPVVVHARIEREDDVVGQHLLQRAHHELGAQRVGGIAEVRPHEGFPLRLPALHLRQPGRVTRGLDLGALVQGLEQLAREDLHIGDEAEVGRVVAAQLLRIDVHVHQPRLGEVPGVALVPARRAAVVEARAQGDHQVGAAAGLVGREGPVAADEAQRQRVVAADAAHAVGRGDDGHAQPLGQLGDLRAGLGQRRAVADEEHRLARRGQQVQRGLDVGVAGAGAVRALQVRGRRQFDVGLFLVHVVGNVQVHRAGAAGDHGVHGLAQRQRQHVHARRLEGALDHGAHHLREVGLVVLVELLERRAVVLRGRHVGGDAQEGRGVRQRRGAGHHHVGRARPRGRERGHGLVLDAEVGVGHVAGALLVARRDELQLVLHVVERVEDADVAVAADAEDVGHLLLHQVLGDELATFHVGHVAVLFTQVVVKVTTRSSVISCTA